MKYFNNCKTLEELRKEYKRLVKQNHPDMTKKKMSFSVMH